MTAELEGHVVVVTGSNRGLGQAIAVAMATEGAHLVLTARQRDSLAETDTLVQAAGGQSISLSCDVSDEVSVAAMAHGALAWQQHVDCVVANAGIAGPTAPMHELTLADWHECLATDLDGVFLTFRAFAPHMVERREGSLVAISSMTGKRPLLGRTPYAAAKMGVIGLVRTLAAELGPYGVRANTICPGAINGPRIVDVVAKQAVTQGVSEEVVRQQLTGASPLGRFVDAAEVADACVFLAGPRSSAITGEDLNVTAGVVMY